MAISEQSTDAAPRSGEVITFYSYKGGTGRSMLLANVGWQLASVGKKVLLIDWDLEAPGLHRYFKPFLGEDVELREQPGVLEWVTDYWEARIDAPDAGVADIVASDADPRRYVRRLKTDGFIQDGSLDLMCAGRQDRHYGQAVADFDWTRLYEKLSGEAFIEVAKEILVGPGGYDFVLIDSRTGVSDTSGFCTVALADTVAVCFTYNNQSMIGASNAARDILQQAHELRQRPPTVPGPHLPRRRFRLFAVPSRVDDLDRERLEKREQQAWGLFNDLLTDVAADQRAAYWGAVAIRNHGQFAYEEVLASCMNRATETQSMLGSVCNITFHLTDGRFSAPNPLSDDQRRALREMFSAQADSTLDVARDGQAWSAVVARLPEATARDSLLETCFPLLLQLYTVAPPPERVQTESADPVLRVPLAEQDMTPQERQMADTLTAAGITQRRITQDGQRALKVTDDSVLAHWKSLRERLLEQLPFMTLRDQVSKARSSWDSAGSTINGLRNLVGEVAGLEFTDEQGAWLGRPNQQFLAAIRAVRAAQESELQLSQQVIDLQMAAKVSQAEQAEQRRQSELSHDARLQALTDEARQREARMANRSRNVAVVAVAMGLLAIGLPMFVQWKSNAARLEIEASRDAAVKAQSDAAASLALLKKKSDEDAAVAAYGRGYGYMTTTPVKDRRYDKAIGAFSDAIKANPQFAEAYQARALARQKSGDNDRPAEIADWAEYCNLRPSLDRRVKFLGWALLTPGADRTVLRAQLAKLIEDTRDPASSDMSPGETARRLTVLLDRVPADLRAITESTANALRGTTVAPTSVRSSGGPPPPKLARRSPRIKEPEVVMAPAPHPSPAPAPAPAPLPAQPAVAAAIAVEPAARVTREPVVRVTREPNENGSNSKAVGWAPFLARPDEVEATRQFKTRVESVPSEKPEKSPK